MREADRQDRQHGYALILDPDAKVGIESEHATITCCHCQRVVFVKAGTGNTVYKIPPAKYGDPWTEEMGAMCALCNKPVCLTCCEIGTCTPWERTMEKLEARDRLRRAMFGD